LAAAPRAPLARLRLILAALLRRVVPARRAAKVAAAAAAGSTALERALAAIEPGHPGCSGFVLLEDGPIAFMLRAALADRAERRIDVQYYAYLADATGTLLMQRLLAAADRGVRVRILLDDSGLGWRDRVLAELDAHPAIELKLFNPSSARHGLLRVVEFLFNMRRLNRRMHNKIFAVDRAAAIVGGRNVSDSYFVRRSRQSFRDYDVAAFGPAAAAAAGTFERFWQSPLAVPAERLLRLRDPARALESRRRRLAQRVAKLFPDHAARTAAAAAQLSEWLGGAALHWAPGEVIADDPDRASGADARLVAGRLAEVLARAEREVLIESAYLVPGEEGLALFAGLVRRGLRVRILTNSLAATDVPVVHAGYAPYRERLLAAGVELHEFRRTLHAKVLVVDRRTAWVGSFNVDPRSVELNTEAGVLIESPSLAAELAEHIESDLGPENAWRLSLAADGGLRWGCTRQGRAIESRREPEAALWRRVHVALFSLIPGSEGLL
jgi:putative cardiolipin synthase